MKRGMTFVGAIAVAAFGAAPALAQDSPTDPPSKKKATVSVSLGGVSNNRLQIGERVEATANLRPYQSDEKLKVILLADGKVVERDGLNVRQVGNKNLGQVNFRSKPITKPARYVVRVIHFENPTLSKARDSSSVFRINIPDVDYGEVSQAARTFNDLLGRYGYGNAPNGARINAQTARAVHAFRKVNGMSRNEKITPDVFQLLATGRGEYDLKYPDAGKHVEVDISRQVMVLADEGEAKYTYHISSGAPSTPSDRGHYNFYWKDPGYNSLGMYFSAYYNGGEATHGYASVPDYNASHGCLRNPIPDSIFIYNWINVGDDIWVYD